MSKPKRIPGRSVPPLRWPWLVVFFAGSLTLFGCGSDGEPVGEKLTTIVFKHGKIAGDPAKLAGIIAVFEAENPDIKVKDEPLPASTDEQHQFYVINLQAGSADFDVLSMDVIWIAEFARLGWLRDLSHLLDESEREDFFHGPIEAVTYEGKIYAIPWYIDAGLLYYRKDLLEKYGYSPPQTWEELVGIARTITAQEDELYGFIWQGKQYEGLVCNALEYLWSHGGEVIQNGEVVLNSPQNVKALQFMRHLITEYQVSPALVTTMIEEPTRHIFGNGRALFLRNWPYAWNIFQQGGSAIKGKVGVCKLPAFPGFASASTLGGWQLGVNGNSKHPQVAEKFIEFMTSPRIQKRLALTVGYKPTRIALYEDPELLAEQPFFVMLYDVFTHARPRPVSPYYMMITQVLQPEFSAVVSGIRTPAEALQSAHQQVVRILEMGD